MKEMGWKEPPEEVGQGKLNPLQGSRPPGAPVRKISFCIYDPG